MKNSIIVNLFHNLNLTIKVTRPHTPFGLPFGKSLIYITLLATYFILVISVKQEADSKKC